jgi:MFS family permease
MVFHLEHPFLIVLQLATGFCQTFQQSLAVRVLFGIAMGGVYGNAVVTVLKNCPKDARGFLSGLFQSESLLDSFWQQYPGKFSTTRLHFDGTLSSGLLSEPQ